MRNLITATDTAKATIIPTASTIISEDVNALPKPMSLSALMPNMTGTARKNVNSAAATLDTPIMSAPIMVEPLLEVPGIIDST